MHKKIYAIRRRILRWYRQNKRDLPWRRTNDPYAILVSEVMLQQTQVDRVIPKYEAFLARFPTIEKLADASLGDVLKLWSGLGYNRRAKYLKQMAEMVMNGYNGQIPDSYDELRKLPGIGDYTANAVLCFAFKKKAPAVDTNVRNVIENEFGTKNDSGLRDPNDPNKHPNAPNEDYSEHWDALGYSDRVKKHSEIALLPISQVKRLLLHLMPQNNPDEFLHALMDYSAMTLPRPQRNKRSSVPFKQSNRYLRGRILARLTDRSLHQHKLLSVIEKETQRSQEDILRALDGLLKDHLITRLRGLLQLPSGPMAPPRQSQHALVTSGSNAR